MAAARHPKGFRFLGRRRVCANSKLEVFFDHLRHRGRLEIRDYMVVAPRGRGRDLVTGVAILPVVAGKICLIRIWRHAIAGYSWEIPKGFIEPREGPRASALRELEEETGLTCPLKRITPLGHVTPDAGVFAARVAVFAALGCRKDPGWKPGEIAHAGRRLFKPSELSRLIRRSKIQDSYTLAAFAQFQERKP